VTHASQSYRSLDLTWEQFCKERVGITRPTVDKIIRQLEEFGPAFFQLASIMRITADEYRLIAGSVEEDGVVYEGEKIAINVENTSRLMRVVNALRSQAGKEAASEASLPAPPMEAPCEPEPAADPALGGPEPAFSRVEKTLFSAIGELTRLSAAKLDVGKRLAIQACVMMARDQLDMIALSTRI